ncbi:MAG: DNA-3-methyladenine glycosylase 2 family protein, partial [Acidobacteriota bacterium]
MAAMRSAADHEMLVPLPASVRLDDLVRYWGRDRRSVQERADADGIRWALRSPAGRSMEVRASFEASAQAPAARVAMRGVDGPLDDLEVAWVTSTVPRLLGLHLDPGAFEASLRGGPHARLVEGRLGLSVPQTATAFDGALWVICGQQVSLPVAFSLRRRLAEHFGIAVGELFAPPRPADLVDVDPDVLYGLGLSRRKTEYVLGLCRLIADGLDLESLRGDPADDVEVRLLDIRGFGPWSVNYLLMRSFGDADRVPVGDA